MKKIPHVIPYQGSKRKLAEDILSYINFDVDKLYEPFVGSGAITLACAVEQKAKRYVISDKLESLTKLWEMIVNDGDKLVSEYSILWNEQLEDPPVYYNKVRDDFNKTKSPSALLYLIARCVKNAVRFNNIGEFNQSPDHRRLGLKPEKLQIESKLISKLLKNNIEIMSGDFRECIKSATSNDLIYMDPPWQGTSGKKDSRYAHLLDIDELIEELNNLNVRDVPYMLSFDGTCGDKAYGTELPDFLNLHKVGLNAGRSSQATLLGRDDVTIESLYLSPSFMRKMKKDKSKPNQTQLELIEV
jgi:DNA adenine methylase